MDKRFSINEQNGVNYLATICKVGEVFPIEGADRLVKTVINGFDIVISKDHKPGDIVVYFPVETSICEQYLSANNLYEMGEFERNSNAEDVKNILIKSESLPDDDTEGKLALLNEAKSKCGFFNKHGRVRILKLRGQYSQGFIATVDSIVNFDNTLSDVDWESMIGCKFNQIGDIEFCKKYIPFVKERTAHVKGDQSLWKRRMRKLKKFNRIRDDQFAFHYDSKHLEDEYIVEGQDPNITIRGCLKAPEGRYVVSLDYDAEEMKVLCLISNDHLLYDIFKRGDDPHERTAIAIWGAEHYDKGKRKKAKICLGNKTFVYTSNGLKHPSQLQEEDKIIGEQGEEQTWVMTTQEGDLIEVEYDNGIIEEYTPEHKIKVWDGSKIIWKEVQHLTSKDEIIQLVGNHKNKSTQQIVDYSNVYEEGRKHKNTTTSFDICSNEFAYFGGLFLGDGNILYDHQTSGKVKPNCVQYCVEPESLKTVISYCEQLNESSTEDEISYWTNMLQHRIDNLIKYKEDK